MEIWQWKWEKIKGCKRFAKIHLWNWKKLDYSAYTISCSRRVATKFEEELKDKQKYMDNLDAGWNFTGNNLS